MMTKLSWYRSLGVRVFACLAAGGIVSWLLYIAPLPDWLKTVVGVVVISGMVIAPIAAGPLTYRQYVSRQERLQAALERQGQ